MLLSTYPPDVSQKLQERSKSQSVRQEQCSDGHDLQSLIWEVEAVRNMVNVQLEGKFDIPRLACILPPWEFECEQGLSEDEQSPKRWMHRLSEWEAHDFREGKGLFQKKSRLFMVCAQTHRLVPCGPNGHGYELCSLRKWASMATGAVTAVLEITCATFGAVLAARTTSTIFSQIVTTGAEMVQEGVGTRFPSQLKRYVEYGRARLAEQEGQPVSSPTVSSIAWQFFRFLFP